MLHFVKKAFIFIMMTTATAYASDPNDITYMTEQYAPYNFEADGKIQGIATDVMLTIMKQLNINQPIKMLPWANSYNKVQTVPNTCLFSMTLTPERKPLFKWVGPVADSNITLVGLKKNNIKIQSIADVNNYKVGVIRSDIGELLLLRGGIKAENIDATSKTVSNIKKLVAGRIDLVAYGEAPLKWEIKQNGFNPDDFETVFNLSKGELFFAFHKKTPANIIQDFQKALEAIKADGTYQTIVDKYLR